jgi:hypothetical protein
MFKNLSRRVLVAAAALALAAGCSSNSQPFAPGQSSSVTPSLRQAAPGTRVLPGPVVSGPAVVPLVPRQSRLPHVWPAKTTPILFVANLSSNEIVMYNPAMKNPSPEGSITQGVLDPSGVAVDKKGTLYVSNEGDSSITEYPAGQTSPSVTITTGISSPYGVSVDNKGDVFASNLGNNTVVGYKRGKTTPFETINFSALGQPVGVAADSKNNVWVACDSTNAVFMIPAGSSTPQNAGMSNLNGPIGISFGKSDVTYVANFGATPSAVEIYAYGTTTPSGSITTGIEQNGPTLNAFTHSGIFFQSNQFLNVVGYKKGQTKPFSTITGLSNPVGVASSPEIMK